MWQTNLRHSILIGSGFCGGVSLSGELVTERVLFKIGIRWEVQLTSNMDNTAQNMIFLYIFVFILLCLLRLFSKLEVKSGCKNTPFLLHKNIAATKKGCLFCVFLGSILL